MRKEILVLALALMPAGAFCATGSYVTPPGGSNGQIQFNNNRRFGGDPSLTFSTTTKTLSVSTIAAQSASISTLTVTQLRPPFNGFTSILGFGAGASSSENNTFRFRGAAAYCDFTWYEIGRKMMLTGASTFVSGDDLTTDIGEATTRWTHIYGQHLIADEITASSGTFTSTVSAQSLILTGSTGTLKVVGGSVQGFSLKTVASNYNASASDHYLLVDASTASFTVTLYTAAGNTTQDLEIKRIDSSTNTVTIGTTSSQTIDGYSTWLISMVNDVLRVVSDGSNWRIFP